MQSSATVMCRALVMLVCVVAIPLVALFGTSARDLINTLLDGHKDAGPASARALLPEAPPFDPASQLLVSGTGPRGEVQAMVQQPGSVPLTPVGTPPPITPSQLSAAPGYVPPPPGGIAGEGPHMDSGASRQPDVVPVSQPGAIPAGYETPLKPPAAPRANMAHEAIPVAEAVTQPAEATDPLTEVQRRLRGLGATHYVLEFWGDRGDLYRFSCEVAIGAGSNYNRHFEATASDQLQAMGKVLQEVEAWRSRQ